jgi:enolase
MAIIQTIQAREILDSRGVPTVECSVWLDTGVVGVSSVPTGTSKGRYEALELRDNDPGRMLGKGVLRAVEIITTQIAPQLAGLDPTQQEQIDQIMIQLDGTANKSKLGANTTLAVSQAVLKAAAYAQGLPIYWYLQQKYQFTPTFNIPTCIFTLINGGEHGADNLDIQEFQILPASFLPFSASLEMASILFRKLEEVLITKGAIHSTGLVGGFTPNLYNNADAFEILIETIKTSPYTFAQDLFFGVDIAAAELFNGGKYSLKDKSQPYSSAEFLDYHKNLRSHYHVTCIEDPFQEDDVKSWQTLTAEIGETTLVVGDALLASNKDRTAKAIADKLCNGILIKPNEVGTLTEVFEVIKLAKEANWQVVISHRSGETNDDLIADLAIGVGADYVKFGPPNRGERMAKYNRLLQIETEIASVQNQSAAA